MIRWSVLTVLAMIAGGCGDGGPLADLLDTAPVAFGRSVSDEGCVDENGELTFEGCGQDGSLVLCDNGRAEWLRSGSDIVQAPRWSREGETLVLNTDGSKYVYTYDAPNLISPEDLVWTPKTVSANDCP